MTFERFTRQPRRPLGHRGRIRLTPAQRNEVAFIVETYLPDLGITVGPSWVELAEQDLDRLAWACGTQREIHVDNDNGPRARMMGRVCQAVADAGGHDPRSDVPAWR